MAASSPPPIVLLMREAQDTLASALQLTSNEARLEASMLLCRALGDVNRAWLIAHEQDLVAPEQHAAFETLLQRRFSGEPLAYILGEREFYGLSFRVTPAVLIPRPETELLVDLALQRLPPQGRALDMGTGSGAIALSIAHARPDIHLLACDAHPAALEVAGGNAQRLGVHNAEFVQSDWFASLDGQRFDLIVSNPPYVVQDDPHLQQGDLRFEPMTALASGPDGLEDIRRIVADAPAYLHPGGWLLLEHGYDQAEKVRDLLQQTGFSEVFSARDLAGIERTTGGRLTP